jgi:hypothetical protein
MGSNRNN